MAIYRFVDKDGTRKPTGERFRLVPKGVKSAPKFQPKKRGNKYATDAIHNRTT